MAIVIIRNDHKTPIWLAAFKSFDPKLEVYDYSQPHPQNDIKMAAVWKHTEGSLNEYPNLEVVHSMGAGVDFILEDSRLNPKWQILRVKDKNLASDMAEYILAQLLSVLKELPNYHHNKIKRLWIPQPYRRISDVKVGIMGLGTLGLVAADLLEKCGFSCLGWTRESNPEVPFPVYSGMHSLKTFLNQSQILVCLLPLTPQTRGILNYSNLQSLPKNAHVINVARGPLLVESDLLLAIENGLISGATLDVFSEEPLSVTHPFWTHPKISITPHIASVSDPYTVVPQILENYWALLNGGDLLNQIALHKGY